VENFEDEEDGRRYERGMGGRRERLGAKKETSKEGRERVRSEEAVCDVR
jgi:hypothetical protein